MRYIFFVFIADVVQHLGIRRKRLVEFDGPGFGVGLGIVYRNFNLQFAEVYAMKTLGDFGGIAEWTAAGIEPQAVAQADGFDDERIAIPFSRRVAVPTGIGIDGQRAAVGENLAIAGVQLIQDDEQAARLDNFAIAREGVEPDGSDGEAVRERIVGTIGGAGGLHQRGGPGLIGDAIL